jgi:hypothetical protein
MTIHLEDPFPLTPALSPLKRETFGGAANGAGSCEYYQMVDNDSRSCAERVRVRGNSMSNCIIG